MSVIARLEDAIINASIAAGVTGKTRLVGITAEDARRILAALRLHKPDEPGARCAGCGTPWPCGTAVLLADPQETP